MGEPPAPFVGAWPTDDGTRFRVWAPEAAAVHVRLHDAGGDTALEREPGGYWITTLRGVGPGRRYSFVLDAGPPRPDPASLAQAEGVHGPSLVVEPAFAWTDADWVPPDLLDSVF